MVLRNYQHLDYILFYFCSYQGKTSMFHHNYRYYILRLFDTLPNFLFTQEKRCAIITYEHGIYELPHVLSKGLRLRILGN